MNGEPIFSFAESWFKAFDKLNAEECKFLIGAMKAHFYGNEIPTHEDRLVNYLVNVITEEMTTKKDFDLLRDMNKRNADTRWSKAKAAKAAADNAEQEQPEKPASTSSTRFAPPPLKEVVAYFTIDLSATEEMANAFYDYFVSNGWKVGGKASMKDWKAAARGWKSRDTNNGKPLRYETQYERDVRSQQQLADDLARHAAEQCQRELAIARGEIETGHVPLEIRYGK